MKKTTKIFAAAFAATMAIGSITLVSCEKGNNLTQEHSAVYVGTAKGTSSPLYLSDEAREGIASEMAIMFAKYPDSYSQINNAVKKVMEYGLDENIKLYDILELEKSVFLDNDFPSADLYNALKEANTLSENGFLESNYYGNLQLYWPYHDEWDGMSVPIVCFAPNDLSSTEATGFVYSNGEAVEVKVNAKDADEQMIPIIIINQSEIPYENYPNFKYGEREKNGIIWSDPYPISPVTPKDPEEEALVYEARSLTFTSSGTQFDYFWAGGSEFELQSIYAADATNLLVSSKARAEFSRKEIKEKRTKNFGTQLHENWQPELGNIHLILSESDDWGSIEPIVINLDVAGNTLSTTVNFNSSDDEIFSGQYTRSNYFNRWYNYNGVFYLGTERVDCMLDVYNNYDD